MEPPKASDPDVVAGQSETSLHIRDSPPSYQLADTTEVDIPTDDNGVITLFQKHNYKVELRVGMKGSSLHPVVSAFSTDAGPISVDQRFLSPSFRKNSIRRQVTSKIGFEPADPHQRHHQAGGSFG